MKTNQNMIRQMGNYDVIQRIEDGYFDANALLYQWNKNINHTRRRIDDFLSSQNTKEFISTIIKEEQTERGNFAIPNNQIVIKGKVKTLKNGSKIPASVWMHPFLFIDFAMWINPRFKYDVLKFVYDEMIKYRHEAGDEYRNAAAYWKQEYEKLAASSERHCKAYDVLHTCYQLVSSERDRLQKESSYYMDLCDKRTGQMIQAQSDLIRNIIGKSERRK